MDKKRKKREDAKRRNVLIFTGIAALVMILSGMYFLFPSGVVTPAEEPEVSTPWNTYQLTQLGNFSVLVKIEKGTSDLIALPEPRVITLDRIETLINSSIPGVNYVSCDATNFYFLCTFNLQEENATEAVKEKLQAKFRGNYHLMRGFIGSLPAEVSGTDEIYLIGKFEHELGDYLRVFLFRKDSGGLIAFEEKELFLGERIPAKVLNITGYSFSGTIAENFNLTKFSDEIGLDASQANYLAPSLLVEKILDTETISQLESLVGVGVNVNLQENKTQISFNHSFQEIKGILKKEEVVFTLKNGTITFNAGIKSYIKGIEDTMGEYGVLGVVTKRVGMVSFSPEVILKEKIAFIENSENFPTSLELDTEVGDEVNISLSIIYLGEQVLPFGANEVE